ncbi:TonB-dependent receptor [Parasphingopyxis sp. GrpM-11]|uniref:TonB-dependent receptor n=2 Tax=Parasphingopyxis marina TaxID=2761622 RepID=A0A842HU90_9SPHN|nr:TonB-dependent receptor [Parasphingopyxis marina]
MATDRMIDVPAGDLGFAIRILSRQADLSIGLGDRRLAGLDTRRVRGRMTAEEALVRLLEGTNARAIRVGATAWRIVPAHPARPAAPAVPVTPPPVLAPPVPIIVTASKRNVELGDYAGDVTVLDGDRFGFGAGGVGTDAIVDQLAAVSSTHAGSGRNKLFIRGIADSSFLGPTQATVGQYLGDTRLNYNMPDPDLRLYDIERVEILAGPQGTLHGAGSLGGIIRIVRNPPRLGDFEGTAAMGGSWTQHGDFGGDFGAMLNIPLVRDEMAIRLVGYGGLDGGYIDDRQRGLEDINDVETYGGRASIRFAASDTVTIDVGGAVQSIDAHDSQYADRNAPPLTRDSPFAQGYSNDFAMADLAVSGEWGDIRFVSSTGIVRQTLDERFDASPSDDEPLAFDQASEALLVSTENRISQDRGDGFGWLAGMGLAHNQVRVTRLFGPPGDPMSATGVENSIDEFTLFAEASAQPLDGLLLTAGARVTHARLRGLGLDIPVAFATRDASADRSETTFLPSASALLELAPRHRLFVRFQQGFRPGGLAVRDEFVQRFENDRVSTIEAGWRYGEFGGSPFAIAATLAHTRWKDIQADIVDGTGFPTTANIGDGRIYTLDVQASWQPSPALTLDFGLFVNDSEVTNPLPALLLSRSAPLPNVADIGAVAGVRYESALGGDLRLNLSALGRYVGESRLGIGPMLGEPQGDFAEADLHVRIGNERSGVSLSATNIFDAVGNRFALGTPFTLGRDRQDTPLRPRTLRLGFDTRF